MTFFNFSHASTKRQLQESQELLFSKESELQSLQQCLSTLKIEKEKEERRSRNLKSENIRMTEEIKVVKLDVVNYLTSRQ